MNIEVAPSPARKQPQYTWFMAFLYEGLSDLS